MKKQRKPVHTGVFFERRMMRDTLSHTQYAALLGISVESFEDFIKGRVPCTFEMATRISTLTNTSVSFWTNMQVNYDEWIKEYFCA